MEDRSIHYVRGGSGPPLVLLHGWSQTWWTWRFVMPELARDRTVIALDLPGLGDSTPPPGGYDFATTAKRIREAVHKLGCRRIEILAHDIGSSTAYRYARDYPDEVARMAVLETMVPGFGAEEDFANNWRYLFMVSNAPFSEKIVDDEDVVNFFSYFYDGAARYPEAVGREEYFRQNSDPAERKAAYDYCRALG